MFGHHYAHHQDHSQTADAVSGFRINAEVDVFPVVVSLLVTNIPTTTGNTSTSAVIRKPEAASTV
jgi:hypothetical protein